MNRLVIYGDQSLAIYQIAKSQITNSQIINLSR
jgi:hypothetical protein